MIHAHSKAAIAVSLFLAGIPGLVNAQGEYSMTGANRYVAQKDWPALLAYTKAWTRTNPNDAMAWYYLGQTYGTGFDQPAAAANAFRRAVALRQEWPEAWHALSITCIQSQQYQQGIAAAKKALAQAPERPKYWHTLAAAYSQDGLFNEERTLVQEQERHMSQASYEDWYTLGHDYGDLREPQAAITAYSVSIRMKSDFGDAWNNRGSEEEALGQDGAALADFQRASELGDSLAGENYSNLKQAIAAAQRAGSQSGSGGRRGYCQVFATKVNQRGEVIGTTMMCH